MSAIPLMSNALHSRVHREAIERSRSEQNAAMHPPCNHRMLQQSGDGNNAACVQQPIFKDTYMAGKQFDPTRAFRTLQSTSSNIIEGMNKMFNRH